MLFSASPVSLVMVATTLLVIAKVCKTEMLQRQETCSKKRTQEKSNSVGTDWGSSQIAKLGRTTITIHMCQQIQYHTKYKFSGALQNWQIPPAQKRNDSGDPQTETVCVRPGVGRDNNWCAFIPKPSQGREREGKARSAAALGGNFFP
jgi:hypothetical protein